MAGSFSRPYFRTNASKLHSGPRWPSSTSFTSYGVAFRVRASAITWSVGTYMNSASLSTNFSMSHGHATRSTRGCSRVIHFMSADDDGSRAIKRGVRRRLDLRAEDDERAQREHPEQREERRRDRRPSACRAGADHRERRGKADDHEEPEHDPHAEDLADRTGDRERDEEHDDEDGLEDHEV